ncbi:hypothetical protein, partial [Vibrio owensii]|uniref:hypothetical protein n=1 Tax=Vibrio owensii TaxID=696485 RepID=UPI00391A4C09
AIIAKKTLALFNITSISIVSPKQLTLSIRPAATFQVRYRLLSFQKKVCMLALIFMKQIENQYESVCSHTQLDGALAPNCP